MRMRSTIGVALTFALAALLPSEGAAQSAAVQSCSTCIGNPPSQCMTVQPRQAGMRVCTDEYHVCILSGGVCYLDEIVETPEDTANSAELAPLASMGGSLRRSAGGRMFLKFDTGKITAVTRRSDGVLVLTTCGGAQVPMSDWLKSEARLSEAVQP
jgi:hypothetical protein